MPMRLQSVFIGGIVAGVLSTSYLSLINVLCCLGVMLGGGTAAWHYITTANRSIDPVEGATLGAGAGLVGSLLSTLFDWILQPLNLDGESVIQSLMGVDMQQMMQEQQGQMMQEPSTGLLIVSMIMGAVLLAVFGAIGGAVGASLFGADDNDDLPTPPDPPSRTSSDW